MGPIQRIRGIAAVLTGLPGGLVLFGATSAFGSQMPGGSGGPRGAGLGPYHRRDAPGWQISRIAVGRCVFSGPERQST